MLPSKKLLCSAAAVLLNILLLNPGSAAAQTQVLPGPTSSPSTSTPAEPLPPPTALPPAAPVTISPTYEGLGGGVAGKFSLYPLHSTPPTLMTSINYPGVYGSYYYGAAPQAWTQGVSAPPMTLRPSWTTLPPSVAAAYGSPLYGPPPVRVSAVPAAASATITIHAPAGASVWVQDEGVAGIRDKFVYTTPRLRPNQLFSYEVRAAWSQDGQPVTDSRTVILQSGERHVIGFSEKKLTNGKP
jgi:uncharacterized protein (TIGR03000 family)